EVEFPLEPLAHDLHVEKPEESAAKAEAERLRGFGLVKERRVVELQLLERVAELGVVVRVGRIQAGENRWLDVLVAWQRLGGAVARTREGVANTQAADVLQACDDIADLSG